MDRSLQVVLGLLFAGMSLLPVARGEEAAKPEPLPQTTAVPVPPSNSNSDSAKTGAAASDAPVPITPAPTVPLAPDPANADAATVVAPPAATPAAPLAPPSARDDVDMIGDKPEAAAAEKPKPLMEDLVPDGPVDTKASHCYDALAATKTHMEQISKDLDNGGREITRLIKTSDALAKKINDLADIWSDDDTFHDMCGTTKRDALNLNMELSQVPRKWTHVRWAYNDTLTDLRKLRLAAKELADAEPKPIPVVGKDGKTTYVDADPNVNPAIAKRDMRKAEAEAMRARAEKIEQLRRNPPLQTDIPNND